jgi:hypothetical protein
MTYLYLKKNYQEPQNMPLKKKWYWVIEIVVGKKNILLQKLYVLATPS